MSKEKGQQRAKEFEDKRKLKGISDDEPRVSTETKKHGDKDKEA